MNIENRIVNLRKFLAHHSFKYYIEMDSEISDAAWDKLAYELVDLQKEHGIQHGWGDQEFFDWDGHTGMHVAYLGETVKAGDFQI